MDTTNTAVTEMSDTASARRLREYASDLAGMVAAGDITDAQANEWLADAQDRLARDGAWA